MAITIKLKLVQVRDNNIVMINVAKQITDETGELHEMPFENVNVSAVGNVALTAAIKTLTDECVAIVQAEIAIVTPAKPATPAIPAVMDGATVVTPEVPAIDAVPAIVKPRFGSAVVAW